MVKLTDVKQLALKDIFYITILISTHMGEFKESTKRIEYIKGNRILGDYFKTRR